MLERQQILDGLNQFYGSEQWHRFNPMMPNILLTDGAKWLADNAGCFWLMDVVASYQIEPKVGLEDFQAWIVRREGAGCVVTGTDGNDNVLVTQSIEFTDFPLDTITLFVGRDGPHTIIYLPSEH